MSDLARDLWAARRDGRVLSVARGALPVTVEEAYAVQNAVVAASGLPRRGYKVGSTSEEAQRHLGTDQPGMGVLLAPFVHVSPARITLPPGQEASVEGEFAFRLGRDLPPREVPYARSEIEAAIDAVAGAVEIVGTRFEGGQAGKGRYLTIADCAVNMGLVTGPWTPFAGQDLCESPVSVTVNGVAGGSGVGARALGDPINVMLWIANRRCNMEARLEAGDIISTGTCTGLDHVRPGDRLRVEFGVFGAVEAVFD